MGGLMPGITSEQEAALRRLRPVLAPESYLAGGVAIALTLGHRYSRDLDIFVPVDFDAERLSERLQAEVLDVRMTGTAHSTLHLEVSGVPTSILGYRYPLLHEPQHHAALGVRVASLEDLLCMKLSAIASRGLARDFWDLWELLEHGVAAGSLSTALALYQEKFASDDVGHVVRSLAYFDDAEAGPLPRGLNQNHWSQIRRSIEERVRSL